MATTESQPWRIWVDTGGTFTDCLALDPENRFQRVKVLSSSRLRGRIVAVRGAWVTFESAWDLPLGFAVGAGFRALGSRDERRVVGSSADGLQLHRPAPPELVGVAFELVFEEEAPVLAARLITGSADIQDLPKLEMRLATTRGTNALLERRGAKTAFFVTRGFKDLLRIGEQHRPDLFARRIRRPDPLYDRVIEVDERLDRDGKVLRRPSLAELDAEIEALRRDGFESAAIALMFSYLNPEHEELVIERLKAHGFDYLAASAELTPMLKILPRARTAVIDAYLAPVVSRYLQRVSGAVGESGLKVMTSAGGLVDAAGYRAKDSLLSGPAGGVVGAARSGREHGFDRVIAFDMGGTSTDVSRYDGEFDYRFEQQVGGATLAAPALAIETVAAGGGSICRLDHQVLKVGPGSAGASPGPACYGSGGPLTITDVHLLLGRLDGGRFEIPIDLSAAECRAESQMSDLRAGPSAMTLEDLLRGYLRIANQRMADAVRQISVRRGYDPARYTMVAFGGAGGLHACDVAEQLAITRVLWPREAGLLSAFGLGAAVVERFEELQVLRPLAAMETELETILQDLADRATAKVERSLVGEAEARCEVRRRLAFVRLAGQESPLEVPVSGSGSDLNAEFFRRYEERYGYRPEHGVVELESLRVIASSEPLMAVRDLDLKPPPSQGGRRALATGRQKACFDHGWVDCPIFELERLETGDSIFGPALIFDRHASFVVPKGWQGRCGAAGVVISKDHDVSGSSDASASDPQGFGGAEE